MVYKRKDHDKRERRELASVVYIPSVPSGSMFRGIIRSEIDATTVVV